MRPFHFRVIYGNLQKGLLQIHCSQCSTKPLKKLFSCLLTVTRSHQPLLMSLPQSPWKQELSTTAAFLQQFQKGKDFDVTKNPYFAKYSEKLKDLAKENPEEYERKIAEVEQNVKEAEQARRKELSEPPKPLTGKTGSWPPKTLDEIMKVEMVQDKSAVEIEEIWKQHHLHKDGVFSVIKKADFDAMMSNAKEFPTFIYALPRADGYEFILSQFSENNVYFTSLQMFQMLKENAQASLTVAHFPDFKDTKGIVLMAGKFDEKFLNQVEAVNLVKQMALFYGMESGERHHLVAGFNKSPNSFNYMDVVEEYKKIRQKVELFA